MRRRIVIILATSFLVIAFGAGYLTNLALTQPRADAAPARSATAPQVASAATSTSVDSVFERAYAQASRSVVFVNNVGVGSGSGIVFDTNGDIVTNDHVVAGSKKFQVTLNNGKVYPATLVGTDIADDLAVIHVNASGLVPAHFAKAGSYQVAQTVLAIGSPLGLKQTVTSGLISGLDRTQQEPNGSYIPNAIQTSAPINPGNSGGALVTLNGVVVGIPTTVQTSTTNNQSVQDVGFAIPASRVTFVAGQIINTGRVAHTGRPYLGVSVGDSSNQQSFPFFGQGSGSTVAGAVVNQVGASSPAGRAGIQQGDVIVKFNGLQVTSADDLLTDLSTTKPGQAVSVELNRNGATKTIRLTLGELPAN
ncbi:MAG TPA: trypsin-like peptidase domain-containing protein [Chloroflexota bacterium]|nr:trypsin-like peptidase domain-containing protein [Chloroflexota bacterium]